MANENEASLLRKLARKPEVLFRYRSHAEVEMRNDSIEKIDIENMLRRCKVTNVEYSNDETTFRAKGSDLDGRKIVAIVVIYVDECEIKVITAWVDHSK